MKSIVIAAPMSGSGKTTVTLGLMAALNRRGMKVAPFKVGPDFIDPGYHRLAAGTPSINLDGWMCDGGFVRDTFARHAADADIAVIEGVMGLYDGIDGMSEAGSSAQVAKLVGAPVLLVVDARSQARSAAAVVHGFASFDPGVQVAGVIFNNVGSANHERILREAVAATVPGVAVLGCLPKDPSLAIPSRHLGLVTAEDNPLSEGAVTRMADFIEQHLDMDRLLEVAAMLPSSNGDRRSSEMESTPAAPERIRIAVARDAAFCFMYHDNLRLLEEAGAELCFFSPLIDPALPVDISGIYLPGGYPELFAERLAANRALQEAISAAVEAGLPVYAECGGFIYLTQGVQVDGMLHPFVGVFPVTTKMLPRRKALGYREVTLLRDSPLGGKGERARGHEFHYSEMEAMPDSAQRIYQVSRNETALGEEGFLYRNCLASYIHLHFGSSPAIAEAFVARCKGFRTGELV